LTAAAAEAFADGEESLTPARETPPEPIPPEHHEVQPLSSNPISIISVYEDSIRAWLS
jgi:hypothetical protein